MCITHRGCTCFCTTLCEIFREFNKDEFNNPTIKNPNFCPLWSAMHILIMLIIEKALFLLFNAPKMGETRKFRSFLCAYEWVLEHLDDAMTIKTTYNIAGTLDVQLLTQVTPVFKAYAEVIDIAENQEILRSEKLIIAEKFRQVPDSLPKTVEFDKFKRFFRTTVQEKIFDEVLTVNDYFATTLIPHFHYKTLAMLSFTDARHWKNKILEKLGELLRGVESDSDDETGENATVAAFYRDLNRKHKANEEETLWRTYVMGKDVADMPDMSSVERSKATQKFWATYPIIHGDHEFVQIVNEVLIGYVGTSFSERGFSGTKQQPGNVYSEDTASMKSSLRTGMQSGLYDVLM